MRSGVLLPVHNGAMLPALRQQRLPLPLIPNPTYSQFRKPSSQEVCTSLSPQPVATTLRGCAIDFQDSQLPPAVLLPPSSLSPDSCLHIQAYGQQNCMVSSRVEHGDLHL